VRVVLEQRRFGFRTPLRTAYGELREREVLELRVEEGEWVGVGEAAPLEPYDGVSLAAVRDALERCRPLLEDGAHGDREDLVDACWLEAGLPQAVAAVDVALWDLQARMAGAPVAALLGRAVAERVPVSATIAATDRAGAAAEAADAVAAGFGTLKLKVAVGDDAGRLAAVRAVAPNAALRVDANGAWTVDEGAGALAALAPVGLELAEEPVRGIDAFRALRERVDVPLAMDETAADPGAVGSGAADGVCLKLAACGGIGGLLAAADAARAAGSFVYLASTYDGPVGIAAAVHAAAAVHPERPCGLATLRLFDGAREVPFAPVGPGLGVPLRE
jgi:L-alanine-DL-glutamate epimerase-like enolase superfamily enzyme